MQADLPGVPPLQGGQVGPSSLGSPGRGEEIRAGTERAGQSQGSPEGGHTARGGTSSMGACSLCWQPHGPLNGSGHEGVTYHFSSLAWMSRQPVLPRRSLEGVQRSGEPWAGQGHRKAGLEDQGRSASAVSLPGGLWGQGIHWGPEVQGGPGDRDTQSQEGRTTSGRGHSSCLQSSGQQDPPATLTLSPAGPWGPSPPDVPCGGKQRQALKGAASCHGGGG